jgi:two-component system, chemotaxis family, CheB/CheR fusion protein
MPADSGLAFVVVTHQHPGHVSLLPELLQRCTTMPVMEVTNNRRVLPNCVYVSRPEGYLGMLNGRLKLTSSRDEPSGVRLPIDFFFRSLAEDTGERAIGIILSGTASDGVLGIAAIKSVMGMTMAQDPESAKYPSMPRSAVATGQVDYVLPAHALPQRLVAYAKGTHLQYLGMEHVTNGPLSEPMHKILSMLRNRTGHDFSGYKPTTIHRRIGRRMDVHHVKGPQQYLEILRDNPSELDLLFKELLVVVTGFFRDPIMFETLAQTITREILATRPDDSTVRVWVPGCATGEETYSVAILLREGAETLKKRFTFQIFGTDLDSQAIDAARTGVYPDGIAIDVPPARLTRFFSREDDHFRLKKEIREMIVFAPHSVVKDPPFTKMDLICCRNLLIYLEASCQQRVLNQFHIALKPNGLLFLGPSEGVGDMGDHFLALDKKARIFQRTGPDLAHRAPTSLSPPQINPVALLTPQTRSSTPFLSARPAVAFERLLMQRFVPASVIVNDRGDISFIHGRTGNYLEPASGEPHHNVLEMAREGLRPALATALRRAALQPDEVVQEGVSVKTNGSISPVDLTVVRLTAPESVRGLFLITFRPSSVPQARRKRKKSAAPPSRIEELEQEVQFTRESLRSTVEELETTNEELHSSNEELQSTNEELQSTNEELETSKEEMQSLNEELQTINAQLQSKIETSSQANDDLTNLLNGTVIATVFLDADLKIRRFTDEARTIFNLIPGDVGRPLADLVSNLNYDDLVADATEVLRTLATCQREVPARDGGWRLVRIIPYRTTDNVIDGLVITVVDITNLKQAEKTAIQQRTYTECILATLREPFLVLDNQLRVVTSNPAFLRTFKLNAAGIHGRPIYELGHSQWDIPKLRQLLEDILPKNNTLEDFEVEYHVPGLGRKIMILNARRLEQPSPQPGLILLGMEDVTHKLQPALLRKPGRKVSRE